MKEDMAIELKNVHEEYNIEIMLDGKSFREKFLALQDITLSIKKGECVAVIGPNGAGKSTLLRLIAGLINPDKGVVKICGRVGSLLDLGTGFHPELTGRDNLFLNASLYNFTQDEINLRYERILKFADIGKFINAAVKSYSQGMYVRLAFSLAIHVDPDILVIDDCLAVGDENFQMKCIDKVLELKEKHMTIIFVTHDMNLAREVCDRGIYIKNGRIIKDARIEETITYYTRPLQIDIATYRYISAKRQEEEKKRQEEEKKRQEEEKKRQEEEKKRQEEEKKRHEEERRLWQEERKRTQEIKRRTCTIFCDSPIKVIFDSAKMHIYYNNTELTHDFGLHAIFSIANIEYSSCSAIWKIRKISDNERICYLKWRKPLLIFQIWKIKLLDEDVIDLEIIMQAHNTQIIQNERIELCLSNQYKSLEINQQNNKYKILMVKGEPAITFMSLQERQVSGVDVKRMDTVSLYFLTVPKRNRYIDASGKSRYTYFRGRLHLGKEINIAESKAIVLHTLKHGQLKLNFEGGKYCLFWKSKELTKCLGAYTSICSRGIWYDSKQAIWESREYTPEKMVIEGFWPWVPLSQTWEIILKKDNAIFWNIEMEIYKKVLLDIQEVAIMLSNEYGYWLANKKSDKFPEEFTSHDLFRYCLWYGHADGLNRIGVKSSGLPSLLFKPSLQKQYSLIIENSAHIYDTEARLLHCMKVNKNRQALFEPGKYKFFKGAIIISEEKV
jgi:ABC-type polysaccharide/polyol phosphate transport system ATPase subunit